MLLSINTVSQDTSIAGSEQVKDVITNFKGRGAMAEGTPLTSAQDAVKEFKVREGFEVELLAAEPDVAQPLFMSWDSRGRMWVVQYLQYQFPAGLKIIEYDNHLRAQFDSIPKPPPHGIKGADKITIYEDSDGDGVLDLNKDIITGLNIATSVETGHGGIWVANPPYLLFYPDADQDDVPDSDPEVCLSGFGLEDTHSVMNSLEWGPDGWLYGVNGSTTTGEVTCPATGKVWKWQGQMVWRYHPDSRHFEIYAEGGGNTFSLEIDSKGNVFSGTNNGNTRGMYYPQGSYGKKSWGKHGPLTNPYSFGYFKHMAHQGDRRRFAQAFCIYDGGFYPSQYHTKIFSPNSLHNIVWVSQLLRDGSTYRTVDEEHLIESGDRWFRPVYSGVGPDGCVYLADWCDTRLSHVLPVDDWHKQSGRLYRVKPKGTSPAYQGGDLSQLSGDQLLPYLEHPNRWVRRRAVLEIGWRNLNHIAPKLEVKIRANLGQTSLESLWAFALLDQLDDALTLEWLMHPDADIRRWIIRLNGDQRSVSDRVAAKMQQLALDETEADVRSQLAATAKRISSKHGLPILKALTIHNKDIEDKHLPLMIWWGIEAHSETGRDSIEKWYSNPKTWDAAIFSNVIAERLMRRYAMTGGDANYHACAAMLESAPNSTARKTLMTGLQLAFQGTTIPPLPDRLSKQVAEYAKTSKQSEVLLGVLQGNEKSIKAAIKLVGNNESDPLTRIELTKAFATINRPEVVPVLLKMLGLDQQSALKRVALQSLASYDDPKIPATILKRYGSTLPAEHNVRSTADRVLAGRQDWAKQFLEKIETVFIKARDISPDVVHLLQQHQDPEISRKVAKFWPDFRVLTSEENLREIARVKKALGEGKGDSASGKRHFQQRCAVCHKLFDEGGVIAPDLTGYERHNLDFWLPGIIDPNLEIREGYANYIVKTTDNRMLMGMIRDQNPQAVTLCDAANQKITISRSKITSLKANPTSLMPPGLLNGLTDQDLRDLFAYLMK